MLDKNDLCNFNKEQIVMNRELGQTLQKYHDLFHVSLSFLTGRNQLFSVRGKFINYYQIINHSVFFKKEVNRAFLGKYRSLCALLWNTLEVALINMKDRMYHNTINLMRVLNCRRVRLSMLTNVYCRMCCMEITCFNVTFS